MSSSLQPRGPLPARVYWIRRLVVVAVVVLLVVVIAQLLGGSSDGASESDGQAATLSSETGEQSTPTSTAEPRRTRKDRRPKAEPSPRLARPDGPCEDSDVLVEPVVGETPEAGRDVPIRLRLRSQEAEACTWQVSRRTVTVSITSGDDDIWSSRECPAVIPTEDVVVRKARAARVDLVWNARRSDDECSPYTDWAMPGWYHVQTAALAGEPADVAFELVRPVSETITKTITPKPRPQETEEPTEDEGTEAPEKQQDESTRHRAGDDGGGNSAG